jgi:membrane dipeptidase
MGEDSCWLDRYAEFGARMAMFTWNEENALATGAGGDPSKGLTELGKQTLRRMEALHIITDVSQ